MGEEGGRKMKGILLFRLPEENGEFMLAKRGSEWACVLQNVDKKLRDCLKYGHSFVCVSDALEGIRNYLNEEMQDANLSFDDLN